MPHVKRIGGGEWKPSVDLTLNDPIVVKARVRTGPGKPGKSWNLIIWIPGLESN